MSNSEVRSAKDNAEINETIARAVSDRPIHEVSYWGGNGGKSGLRWSVHDANNRLITVIDVPDYTTDANACFDACERLGLAFAFSITPEGCSVMPMFATESDVLPCNQYTWSQNNAYRGPQITPLLARAIAEAVRKGGE